MSAIPMSFGASDAWNAAVYGENNPSTVAFLQNQISAASQLITSAGSNFADRVRVAFDHYNSNDALRFARKVVAQVAGVFDNPHIAAYSTLKHHQDASILMQRWVMANPRVRELYHQMRCDGYSDTYIDLEPGKRGDAHYDYRRVNDGIMHVPDNYDADGELLPEDKLQGWHVTNYFEDLKEGDRHLLHAEQLDILSGWTTMDILLAMGKDDPTSPLGGQL